MPFIDLVLKCVDCGEEFVFSAGEQLFPPLAMFIGKGAKMAPVHLSLLAWRSLKSLYCQRLSLLPLRLQPVGHDRIATVVTVLSQLPNSTLPFQTPAFSRSRRYGLHASNLLCAAGLDPYTGRLVGLARYLLTVLRS